MCKSSECRAVYVGSRALVATMLSVILVAFNVRPAAASDTADVRRRARPVSVAAADLNGDGKPDLAVANTASNDVSVLLNTTPPAASTPPSPASRLLRHRGPFPPAVTAADLNGDGKPDLAVANISEQHVSVLLNTTATGATTPTFAAQRTVRHRDHPRLRGGGRLQRRRQARPRRRQLSSSTVSVLLNTTAPGPPPPPSPPRQPSPPGPAPPPWRRPTSTATASPTSPSPTHGERHGERAAEHDAAGAATPTFAAQVTFATGPTPTPWRRRDLNGDGKPDLAVANAISDTVSVLLNTTATGATTPTFAAQVTFATGVGPVSVAVADLNGDGKPDLAVANARQQHGERAAEHDAGRGHHPHLRRPGDLRHRDRSPVSVAAADLNGDGKPDLAVANFSGNTVSVLLANPSGALQLSSRRERPWPKAPAPDRHAHADRQHRRPGLGHRQRHGRHRDAGAGLHPGRPPDRHLGRWRRRRQDRLHPDHPGSGRRGRREHPAHADPAGESVRRHARRPDHLDADHRRRRPAGRAQHRERQPGRGQQRHHTPPSPSPGREHVADRHRPVRHGGRLGEGRQRLHRHQRHPDLRPERGVQDHRRADPGRHARRAGRDVHRHPLQPDQCDARASPRRSASSRTTTRWSACTPRPRVTQTLAAGGGALNVHVESTPLNTPADNPLQQITLRHVPERHRHPERPAVTAARPSRCRAARLRGSRGAAGDGRPADHRPVHGGGRLRRVADVRGRRHGSGLLAQP